MKKWSGLAAFTLLVVLLLQQAQQRLSIHNQQTQMHNQQMQLLAVLKLVEDQQKLMGQLQAIIKEHTDWHLGELQVLENIMKSLKASKQDLADHLGTLEKL